MTKAQAARAHSEEPLISLELVTSFTALLYKYDANFAGWFSSTYVDQSNDATHAFRCECWKAIHDGPHFAEFVRDSIEQELAASECYWPDFQTDEQISSKRYGIDLEPPKEGEESLEDCISTLRSCLYLRHDHAELRYSSALGTTSILETSEFEKKDSDPVSRWMSGTLGGKVPLLRPIGACPGETHTKMHVFRRKTEHSAECTLGEKLWEAVSRLPDLATTILLEHAISDAYNDYCLEDGLFSRIMNAFPQTNYATRTAEYEHLLPAIRLLSPQDQELCSKYHREDVVDSNKDGFMIVSADLYEELKSEFGSTVAKVGEPYSLTELQGAELMSKALTAAREWEDLEMKATRSFRTGTKDI